MKKLLTLALCIAFAGIASAASVNWDITKVRNTYLWDSENTKGNTSIYLVLADDVSTITAPTQDKDFATLLGEYKLDGPVNMTSGSYAVDSRVATSDKLTAGQEYTFQLLMLDSNGKYSLSSTLKERAYTTDPNAEQFTDATSISFTATMVGAAGQAGGTTWATNPVYQGGSEGIPEPATGALALAGIALLFKRRRA